MFFLRRYATATSSGRHIRVPVIASGTTDFATSSTWTPAAGDVKISIDGGAQANITTLPTYSNGAWEFQLTAAELTGKVIEIAVVDSAIKVVDDQFVIIETFGASNAFYQQDYTAESIPGGPIRGMLPVR